ncbi:SDR family oxidoreductase [Streptomyces sp. NPDC059720]|uniref:SDR family oxidoreductase n=1 Tax=Streptomyces sp. NPDC059720 TaxID=3346924 RepID=UPI0036CAE50E
MANSFDAPAAAPAHMSAPDSSDLLLAQGAGAMAGRRIAVMGATGGIGRALVDRLVAQGGQVAAAGMSHERLEQVRATHPQVLARATDVTDEGDVEAFFAGARRSLGPLDAVVNLVGASVPGDVATTSVETFDRLMSVNVRSTFLSCKHALPSLRDHDGLIVNVGSLAGVRPNPAAPLYCTAKAAVAMFTRAFATQVQDRRVRVTNLTPGGSDTPFWGDRAVDRAALMASDDVADAILFVLSRPAHIVVHDMQFESTGRERE